MTVETWIPMVTEREAAQIAALVEQGWCGYEATEEITRRHSVETQRRQEAILRLRQAGYTGHNLRALCRRRARDLAQQAYVDAENECRGYMLNAKGEEKGVDPRELFTGPEWMVTAYASEELREWFDTHGRLTPAEVEQFEVWGTGPRDRVATFVA